MPIYNYRCPVCGTDDEDIFRLDEVCELVDPPGHGVACQHCGVTARILVGGERTVGRPELSSFAVEGTDINCQSRAEVEAWKAEHPQADVLVPGTVERKRFDDHARSRLDRHADRLGFRNWEACKADAHRKQGR